LPIAILQIIVYNEFVIRNIEGEKTMKRYGGVCPADCGGYQAKEIIVEAENLESAYNKIWEQLGGTPSRYVSRIYVEDEKLGWEKVWEQGDPWNGTIKQ
jgi:hypothetical protein